VAILAVLHTWRQDLGDHPHVHLLVSAGGLSRDGQAWVPARNPAFLVPGYAVSKIFQGKFKAGLKKLRLFHEVPPKVWQQPWKNVQIQHAGRGEKVLDYLGRYAFRIAIANSRLVRLENGQVTFGCRDRKTHQKKQLTCHALEFIGRFLRHVLPKGFVKIRSYGLWASANGHRLQQARSLLPADLLQGSPAAEPLAQTDKEMAPSSLCPKCKVGHLILKASLLPQRTRAP
jgi:hypothetical protein